MDDGTIWLIGILIFVVPILMAALINSTNNTIPKINEEEKKQIEEEFISEIKKSIEFIENDYFEEMVFHEPKDCWLEVLSFRNIKMGKEVMYEPGDEILSIKYANYHCGTRILNITRSEKCLVKWAVHICREDVRNLKDNTFLGCIYVGENNIERYYEEKARKKVIEKHRKKELEKKALLDLIDEGVIYDKEEDIELKHLRQIHRKRNSRT